MKQEARVVAIIQARLGSSRLPGKVLANIAGRPMLWHVVSRVRQARLPDDVWLATSNKAPDDPIVAFCKKENIPCFRGDEDDVLDRYYQIAQSGSADVIVRITADCPLVDPHVVDEVVKFYLGSNYDYVSNIVPHTFPDGLDTEVFSFQALELAWRKARWQSEREHVTPYICKHPELFRIGSVVRDEDLSAMRWTVDEAQDLAFVRLVFGYLNGTSFGMADVLDVLQKHPEIMEINAGIGRDEGYQESVRKDRLADIEQYAKHSLNGVPKKGS